MKTHGMGLLPLFTIPLFTVIQLNAANVVTDWNTIASTTIVKNGGKSPGASAIWFAYTSVAVYDAVNAITQRYRPFYYQASGPSTASVDAAAVAAAHRVLVNYFPSQQNALDGQYFGSLVQIAAEGTAKNQGVMVGEAAAMAVIAARTGDGVEANVTYMPASGPGAWIPTPPAFSPPATPWLGQMRPFVMSSPGDFLPDGPTPLDSEAWKRDYNLTRLYGGASSTTRSAAEKEIGLFWTEHTGQQYSRAFNNLVDKYNLNTADSARLMAMLWTGFSDAAIGCFNAKYKYGFWRPVTAIPAGGGNSDLAADAAWTPLGTTPGHPEYPAAHGCVTGAVSTVIAGYFRTTRVHIVTDSVVFADGVHTHTFEDTRDLMDEVFWARIYAGFHYHHSLEDGRQLGQRVARELLSYHFRPQRDDHDGLQPSSQAPSGVRQDR
jgi:hypothetical protein